jgi:hypothetical protein
MSASISIPDDLLAPLQKLALSQQTTLDQLTVKLLRGALQVPAANYPIRQSGRFPCFELPANSPPLDLAKIQAAMND